MHLGKHHTFGRIGRTIGWLIVVNLCLVSISQAADQTGPPGVLSSRAAFLRAQRASRHSQQQQQQTSTGPHITSTPTINNTSTATATSAATTTTTTIQSAPASVSASTTTSSSTSTTSTTTVRPRLLPPGLSNVNLRREEQQSANLGSNNRSTRTADVFQNGENYNIFVTSTCERDSMHVNIRTSRPFHGVIHTRNQRSKAICTVEGTGETDYNLDISHTLNQQDPNYCGVIKARRESPENKDLLSVVVAVRVHRRIELPDDKFFLLNCTNRCRRADCSSGTSPSSSNNKLQLSPNEAPEAGERESITTPSPSADNDGEAARKRLDVNGNGDECTIYKFPWIITLLWCMGIMLLAMIISHCIMCSSFVCRCVKTEVEERAPSVYEDDDLDDEENLYNKKNHPMRIDYDNRDIYKTSNNYERYDLGEPQGKRDGKSQIKGLKSNSHRTRR